MRSLCFAVVVALTPAVSRAQGRLVDEDVDHGVRGESVRALAFEDALSLASRGREVAGLERASERTGAAREDATALPDDVQFTVEAGAQALPVLAAQGRVGVIQHFSTSRLGDARRDVLGAEGDALSRDAERRTLSRRLDAARAWTRLWAAERTLVMLREELDLASRAETLARRGAEVRELGEADALDATAYCEELRVALLDAEGDRTHSEHDVARATELEHVEIRTTGELPGLPLPDESERNALFARLDADPEVASLASRALSLRARATEARAMNAARVGVGAIVDRQAPSGVAFLFSGALTLPTSGRGEREAASFEAEADALDGEAATRARSRAVDFEETLHELDHSRLTSEQVNGRWAPAVLRQQRTYERLFEAGETTLLEVFRARRASLSSRLRAIGSLADETAAKAMFRELARALERPRR